MYPGANDTDWQVAMFQHQERVAMGQHRQSVASALAATTKARPVSTAIQRQLGTLLLHAGQRLLGLHAISTQSLDTIATKKRAVVA